MRKVSSFIVLALVACGGGSEPAKAPEATGAKVEQPAVPPTTGTADMPAEAPKTKLTMTEIQTKGVAAYMEAMNAHDTKKMAGLYAETANFKSPGFPDGNGRASIEKGVSGLFAGLPHIFNKGEVTVVHMAMTGTHKGDMGPIKATNKPTGWEAVSVLWWNEEGQIKEEHQYWDMGTMMSQIGMSKQKAPGIPTLAAKAETFTSSGNEVETKNSAALKTFYGAFEAKKAADFTALMTDTTEWTDNMMPTSSKGPKEAKKYFDSAMVGFPDAKMTVNNQWAFGDFVITENTFSGTNNGPFMGTKATKKTVGMQGVDIIMMKDGKIAKGWSFGNGMQAAQQLGLIKEEKPAAAKPEAAKPATPAPAAKPTTPATPAPKK
jgi:predicted ester cyclase